VKHEREIEVGPLVAAVGAVILIVSLFLNWYDDFSAFTVFEVWDVVLVCLGLFALVQVAQTLGFLPPGSPLRTGTLLPVGAAALVIVASQLVNHPPAGIDRDPAVGLWLGLAGSAVLLAGGFLATARISLTIDVERRERRRRGPSPDTSTDEMRSAPTEEVRSGPVVRDVPHRRGDRSAASSTEPEPGPPRGERSPRAAEDGPGGASRSEGERRPGPEPGGDEPGAPSDESGARD
jgi:hypothetical protein